MKRLILGGVKSGKSRYAESMAQAAEEKAGNKIIYLATATSGDAEMQARIEKHRQQRPAHWQLVEEPIYLAAVLQTQSSANTCILLDCLTLWLTNLLCSVDPALLQQETQALLHVLPQLAGDIIIVSNETNMGIIPMGELSRRYADQAGMLHQQLAVMCEHVCLCVAGLPFALKGDLS